MLFFILTILKRYLCIKILCTEALFPCTIGTPGPASCQNACWSELSGLYSLLVYLHHICQQSSITTGLVKIHCDGLSAINALNNSSSATFHAKKNFDLINAIITLRQQLPILTFFHHVSSHQDRGTAYHHLSPLARLNFLADDLAKTKAQELLQSNSQPRTASLPLSPIDILIKTQIEGTIKICTDLIDSLRFHITNNDICSYWIDKKDLDLTESKVDWELRVKSISNQTQPEQRWLCKYTTGFCGVGKMLLKYKYQTHTKCPRCGQDN